MKEEHPIIFSTKMVEAIDEGRKTRTRRVIDPQPEEELNPLWENRGEGQTIYDLWTYECDSGGSIWRSPYGRPGDILWVRESFAFLDDFTGNDPGTRALCEKAFFRADYGDIDNIHDNLKRWRPSIHMPRQLCRLFLQNRAVQVVRLQNMSRDDAREEGIVGRGALNNYSGISNYPWNDPRDAFKELWDFINSKPRPRKRNPFTREREECFVSYPWEEIRETRSLRGKNWYVIGNPWVWDIEFRRRG